MCQYQGYEFGAPYLDSVCVNGVLYDADNCDSKGNMYEPTRWLPCPICNSTEWLEYHTELELDAARNRRERINARRNTAKLLQDIRSRRNADGSFKTNYVQTLEGKIHG